MNMYSFACIYTELWSLLNFIEPAKFPDAEKFAARFGKIETQDQVRHILLFLLYIYILDA